MKCTSGAHTSYVHRHLVSSAISRHVRFASSRRSAAKSVFCECRRGKMVIPEQFTVETHPISVRWRRRRQWGGTIIPVYSWHTHSKRTQNTQKCMKFINYLSLLRFSLLLSNCAGSHSAFIYKFKDANCNTHAPMKGPSRPNMYVWRGISFGDGMKQSRIEPQQCICVTCYTPTCANAALLTCWMVTFYYSYVHDLRNRNASLAIEQAYSATFSRPSRPFDGERWHLWLRLRS